MSDWPHAPIHRFGDAGVYFITAGTRQKQHLFRDPAALDALRATLFHQARESGCALQAWALFSNHYHLVISCDSGENVRLMLNRFHIKSAIELNRREDAKGRKVWFQYRDTLITTEGSWLARLKYTHENAVHHGIATKATRYRWCSAAWFESHAPRAFATTVDRIKIDRVSIYDEYSAALPPQEERRLASPHSR